MWKSFRLSSSNQNAILYQPTSVLLLQIEGSRTLVIRWNLFHLIINLWLFQIFRCHMNPRWSTTTTSRRSPRPWCPPRCHGNGRPATSLTPAPGYPTEIRRARPSPRQSPRRSPTGTTKTTESPSLLPKPRKKKVLAKSSSPFNTMQQVQFSTCIIYIKKGKFQAKRLNLSWCYYDLPWKPPCVFMYFPTVGRCWNGSLSTVIVGSLQLPSIECFEIMQ